MYFCYVDESGDTGEYLNTAGKGLASSYFILSGLIVPSDNWKNSLDYLKSFRRTLAAEAYLPYDVEFHCSELVDAHKTKAYTQIKIEDRWKLIARFAEKIGSFGSFSIINVVINKQTSGIAPADYLTSAVTKIYQMFDDFLKAKENNGIVFFDRSSEKKITTHVRKLLNTGSSGVVIPGVRIGRIIEDPIARASHESVFIQAADLIAYTLKEKEFGEGSRKKFNADRIFVNKLTERLYTPTGETSGVSFI